MKAKLIKTQGKSSIIMYIDADEVTMAAIVDTDKLTVQKVGAWFEVDESILLTSTPYGVDWSVVFPDGIVIPATEVQKVLYNNGVVSLRDVQTNTNAVISAINALTRLTSAKIVQKIRLTMEVSDDQL